MKIVKTLTVFVLIACFSLSGYANAGENSFNFVFPEYEISVSGDISEDEAYNIANIFYCDMNGISIPAVCAPCDISGHYYKTTVVETTGHKVYTTDPRCRLNTYEVVTCTKCSSLISRTLKSSRRISCCS